MRQRHSTKFPERRALFFVAPGLFLISLVWQHVQATRLGYRVEKARQQIVAMRCANGTLRMQLETMLSPANLSAQARGRLGMTLAAAQSLRTLDATAAAARGGLWRRLISRTRRALASAAA